VVRCSGVGGDAVSSGFLAATCDSVYRGDVSITATTSIKRTTGSVRSMLPVSVVSVWLKKSKGLGAQRSAVRERLPSATASRAFPRRAPRQQYLRRGGSHRIQRQSRGANTFGPKPLDHFFVDTFLRHCTAQKNIARAPGALSACSDSFMTPSFLGLPAPTAERFRMSDDAGGGMVSNVRARVLE